MILCIMISIDVLDKVLFRWREKRVAKVLKSRDNPEIVLTSFFSLAEELI